MIFVVAFKNLEDARKIRAFLLQNGFDAPVAYSSGAQVISYLEDINTAIVVCSYKLQDMIYTDLRASLNRYVHMLVVAGMDMISAPATEDMNFLFSPFKFHDLIDSLRMMERHLERQRYRDRQKPKKRTSEEIDLINRAKELLMEKNHLTEAEAHRYLQSRSMETQVSLTEMAGMAVAMLSPGNKTSNSPPNSPPDTPHDTPSHKKK